MTRLRALSNQLRLRTISRVALLALTIAITLTGATKLLRSTSSATTASKSRPSGSKQSVTNNSHKLVAPYHSVKGNLKATLMLSNQGPNQLPIQVSLFSKSGGQIDLPSITLTGNEVRAIDLRTQIPPSSSFEEGSVEVNYQGRKLELGGVVTLVDSAHSLIFDEELAAPVQDFASSRLEGVWWRPTGNTEIRLVLSNTTNLPLSATVSTRGEEQAGTESTTILLGAHETRVLGAKDNNNDDELELHGTAGGISIKHTGAPGALVACGLIQEPATGFSNSIDFFDPARAKTSRLDGAGLRFGTIADHKLSQVAVVRNISNTMVAVSGRLPYTSINGKQNVLTLSAIKLAPGAVRKVNLPTLPQSDVVLAAGLEFVYEGSPGSIIASALSLSSDHNQVFRVPMRDSKVQSSSTGHYPWNLDNNSSTIVYVKNATDIARQFTMSIRFSGGDYTLGLQTVAAGQTAVFDVRSIRNAQRPDANGSLIPPYYYGWSRPLVGTRFRHQVPNWAS